ncbi:MAG: hypothetical protein ACFBSE_26410 [Prochloraceae cyanobacterium]
MKISFFSRKAIAFFKPSISISRPSPSPSFSLSLSPSFSLSLSPSPSPSRSLSFLSSISRSPLPSFLSSSSSLSFSSPLSSEDFEPELLLFTSFISTSWLFDSFSNKFAVADASFSEVEFKLSSGISTKLSLLASNLFIRAL